MAVPFYVALDQLIGASPLADRFLGSVQIDYVVDLFYSGDQALPILEGLVVVGVFLAVPLAAFLDGATLAAFLEREPFSLARFLGGGGRYLGRFLRLIVISLLYLVGALIVYGLFRAGVNAVTEGPEFAPYRLHLMAVRWTVLGLLLLLVGMIFDYAKIITVVGDLRSVSRAALAGTRFVAQNLRKTLGLYLTLVLASLLLLVGYRLGDAVIHEESLPAILLALLGQQAYLLLRQGIRVTFLSSQLALYRGLRGSVDRSSPGAAPTLDL